MEKFMIRMSGRITIFVNMLCSSAAKIASDIVPAPTMKGMAISAAKSSRLPRSCMSAFFPFTPKFTS